MTAISGLITTKDVTGESTASLMIRIMLRGKTFS